MFEWIAQYWIQTAFSVIVAALGFGYRIFVKRFKASKLEQDAIRDGICALLRDRIIQAYNHYMDKGCCPIYSRDSIFSMYKEYHALGGNGTVTDLIEDIKQLPTEKRREKDNE